MKIQDFIKEKKKQIIYGVGIIALLSVGIGVGIGITNYNKKQVENQKSADDIFIEDFSTILNRRWKQGDEIQVQFEEGKVSEKEHIIQVIANIQEEVDSLEQSKMSIEDRNLKILVDNYIEGDKLQIQSFETTNDELFYKYQEQSSQLRKPSLIELVEKYGVVIDEENMQTYKDFKAEATIINQEKESKDYLDKLANEIVFEEKRDEWGQQYFVAIVENNFNIDFRTIQYQVHYKDDEGLVVGNDYVFLDNFSQGTKQKITLTPYGMDNVKKIQLTIDYYEMRN